MANIRDRAWIAFLAALFAFGLAASWQRWGDPVVDVGREMNQPLRLAQGEMLYSDVRHIYGPLSPWLHAALFRVLGPSLTILYADGIITATIVLALVYWLGRQVMAPVGAAAATLNVMWFCAFKPAGNYILPYSYNALHGTALSLITLAIVISAIRSAHGSIDSNTAPRRSALTDRLTATRRWAPALPMSSARVQFLLAGVVAGLAVLAKTEMGAAAIVAGITAAVIVAHATGQGAARLVVIFIAPAACLTFATYAAIAARVGWSTLGVDSWLLVSSMPPELAYFNSQISGFAHPLRSIGRMLIAAAKLGIIAAVVAAISSIVGCSLLPRQRHDGTTVNVAAGAVESHPWRVLAGAVGVLAVMSVTTGLDRDKGPYLAMPLVLLAVLGMLTRQLRSARGTRTSAQGPMLITLTLFALASLARILLHVRSGGAYASYLLPASVVIFTYVWVGPFAESFRDPRTARVARAIALTLMIGISLGNAGVLAYRYQTRDTVVVATSRGTIITPPDMGQAFNEALAYIDRHTRSTDAIAVMPEGTSLNFLSGRRNPLREEITTPGYLNGAAEARAIRQLKGARTALILIPNRPTAEFGRQAFGRDYCQEVMRWIEAHYAACAVFGPVKDPRLQIGDKPFFIRVYCLSRVSNPML